MSSATSSLKSSSHDAAERARVSDASRHTAESARSGLRNAREGYVQMLREQPLLVGVLAVAAGAALGTLLPRTSAEDRMLGGLSDKGTDTLREKAQDKLKEQQDKASRESEGASQSDPQPPQLDPASGRDSSKSQPGSNY